MTVDQDIEGALERWFTEGPTRMPSRFLDDTLDRIDRMPRRRVAGIAVRLSGGAPLRRVAAAVAVVLVVVGVGAARSSRGTTASVARPRGRARTQPTPAEWHPIGAHSCRSSQAPPSTSAGTSSSTRRR